MKHRLALGDTVRSLTGNPSQAILGSPPRMLNVAEKLLCDYLRPRRRPAQGVNMRHSGSNRAKQLLQNTAIPFLLSASIAIAALWLCSRRAAFLNGYFNSDSLYMANFFHSVHSHTLDSFHYSHLPNIFPEAMVILSLIAMGLPWEYSYIFYSTLLFFVLVMSAIGIYGAICEDRRDIWMYVFVVLVEILLLIEANRHISFLVIGVHGSSFVVSVAAALLAWRTLKSGDGRLHCFALGLVVYLSALSDILFNFSFALPLVVASATLVVLRLLGLRKAVVVNVVAIAASGLGTVSLRLLPHSGLPPSSAKDLFNNAHRFIKEVHQSFVFECFIPLSIAVLCVCFYAYSRFSFRTSAAEDGAQPHNPPEDILGSTPPLIFFWVFGLSASVATLGVTIIAYVDGGSYRYVLPALWWPILLLPTVFPQFRPRICRAFTAASIVGLMALVSVAASQPSSTFWASDLARCIEQGRRDIALQAGLAEYWTARPVTEMSDRRVTVSQIVENGDPYIWINNPLDYFIEPWKTLRDYNFIILNGLDHDIIFSRFGPPSNRLTCGKYEIAQYNDATKIRDALTKWFDQSRSR